MHHESKPRAPNQSITEESGRPGTCRSKVGCEAIEEPCTKSTVPCFRAPAAGGFCQRNSRTPRAPPLRVQCSFPKSAGRAADATRFTPTPRKSRSLTPRAHATRGGTPVRAGSRTIEQQQLGRRARRSAERDLAAAAQHDAVAAQQHLAVALDLDVGAVGRFVDQDVLDTAPLDARVIARSRLFA